MSGAKQVREQRDEHENPLRRAAAALQAAPSQFVARRVTGRFFRDLARVNNALVERLTGSVAKTSEATLRAILGTASDGIISIDERGRIESFNPAAERIFGYRVEEVVGQNVKVLMPPPYRDEHDGYLDHYKKTGKGHIIGIGREVVGRRKNGSTFPMHLRVGQLIGDGQRFIGIVHDMSEQRRLEDELRHLHKMEAIGTLAAGISHDFNNLLQGIIGCADLALVRLPVEESARQYIDALKGAALGGAAIIAQLMEFGSQHEQEVRVVDLNRLIVSRESLFRRLVGEDVELRIGLGPSEAAVRCDPIQIEQVLMNLLVNARHAMPRGGRLEIETADMYVRRDRPGLNQGRYITLVVRDNGDGMDSATCQRVFEPFFTTKGVGKGTGLGLSMAYAIVTRLGGHIEVRSRVGEGTAFSLYFPRSDEPVGVEPELPAIGGQRGNETVVVVEDEPLVRVCVCHYLERHGYRVLEAGHAEEARRILNRPSEPVDLLITDVVLPGTRGPELAAEAQQTHPNLRVLYMSAAPRNTLAERRLLKHEAPVLQKPFSEIELLAQVREALRDTVPPPPPEGENLAGTWTEIPRAAQAPSSDEPDPFRLEPVAPRARRLSEERRRVRKRRSVLLVEDEALARMAAHEMLQEHGYHVIEAATGRAALDSWNQHRASVAALLTDVGLPDMSGLELVDRLRERHPGLATILISGRSARDPLLKKVLGEPNTVYLEKPVEFHRAIELLDKMLGD